MDTDENTDEAYEEIADRVSQFRIRNEISEKEHVVHEHKVDHLSKDLHPVCECVFHWVEVDQVVIHNLNERKNSS